MTLEALYPSLQGQTIFITGGATGIGAAMVEAFSVQGAKIAFIDIDQDSAQKLIDKIVANGRCEPWYSTIDVTNIEQLKAAIRSAAADLGTINTLINNVANDMRHDPKKVDLKTWRDCMAVNLDASFFAAQTAAEIMREQGGGSIINLSSINALLGPANMTGYVTAKAGTNGMTKALAKDFGTDRIRVNAILPGWVVTERQLTTWLTEEAEAQWAQHVALKDRLTEVDVAKLALFLASDESKMITGQCLSIDAGRT